MKTLFSILVCSAMILSSFAQDTTFTTLASSLLLDDIQESCDLVEANGGGIVYLPSGEALHDGRLRIPDGISLIGNGTESTIVENAQFIINTDHYGKLEKPLRLTGIYFKTDTYIEIRGCRDFRIDHCKIEADGGSAITVSTSYSGLIDHCDISATNYGIVVTHGLTDRHPADWVQNTSALLGSSEAIYIEDNVFSNYHHATVGHANAHYVVRYNTFSAGGPSPGHAVDAHGAGYANASDPNDLGTRLVECYNNVFHAPDYPSNWKAVAIRGGSAVVFNNEFINWRNGVVITLESDASTYHSDTYPHDIWIWDNTHNEYEGWESEVFVTSNMNNHTPLLSEDYIREDNEYFLRAPSESTDGFTYNSYTYPHPFVDSLLATTPENPGVDPTNSQKSFEIRDFELLPNPASDYLKINSKYSCVVSIYDLHGKCQMEKKNASTSHLLDISDLRSGMYLIVLTNADKNYTCNFVKL
jgi:hypothetical protein